MRGDHHRQDERRCRAEAIQYLPLDHGSEKRVAIQLALICLHQGLRLLASTLLTSHTPFVRKIDLALEVCFTGGVHNREVEPNLLARRGMQDGAVKAQPVPIHHRAPQRLQLLVELDQLGLVLVNGQLDHCAQVREHSVAPRQPGQLAP